MEQDRSYWIDVLRTLDLNAAPRQDTARMSRTKLVCDNGRCATLVDPASQRRSRVCCCMMNEGWMKRAPCLRTTHKRPLAAVKRMSAQATASIPGNAICGEGCCWQGAYQILSAQRSKLGDSLLEPLVCRIMLRCGPRFNRHPFVD